MQSRDSHECSGAEKPKSRDGRRKEARVRKSARDDERDERRDRDDGRGSMDVAADRAADDGDERTVDSADRRESQPRPG